MLLNTTQKTQASLVERDGDVIYFNELKSAKTISQFVTCMSEGITAGYDDFVLNFKKVKSVFPNTAAPLAGLINYYECKHKISFEFESNAILSLSKALSPIDGATTEGDHIRNSLGKVWKFSSGNIYKIQQMTISELRKNVVFAKGVLESLEWSLNEIMDNVLNHSESDFGYIMGQLHPTTKHIAFTIFDSGKGIYNSLKGSIHKPRAPIDAITLSLKEGVTRDQSVGQGNGMNGLFKLVKEGKGSLEITSGGACYRYNNGQESFFNYLPAPSKSNSGTTIDFQLDYSKEVSLNKILTFKGKVFEFTNLELESLEDDRGHITYKINDKAEGTGTRESALRAKNEILNFIQQSKKNIIIDFEGVSIISSSFADELIAKLIIEIGLFQFNNIIRLKNMGTSQQEILQRSVIQRIISEYN